jgi:hypothetical protein
MMIFGFVWTMLFSVYETYMTFSAQKLWLHIPAMILQIGMFVYFSKQMRRRYSNKG